VNCVAVRNFAVGVDNGPKHLPDSCLAFPNFEYDTARSM